MKKEDNIRVVHKYILDNNSTVLSLPKNSVVVKVSNQGGKNYMWIEHRINNPKEERIFEIYGTGRKIEDNRIYRGTCFDGPFVWHVYEHLKT